MNNELNNVDVDGIIPEAEISAALERDRYTAPLRKLGRGEMTTNRPVIGRGWGEFRKMLKCASVAPIGVFANVDKFSFRRGKFAARAVEGVESENGVIAATGYTLTYHTSDDVWHVVNDDLRSIGWIMPDYVGLEQAQKIKHLLKLLYIEGVRPVDALEKTLTSKKQATKEDLTKRIAELEETIRKLTAEQKA